MKNFLLAALCSAALNAYTQDVVYKDIEITEDKRTQADQAMCLDKNGNVIKLVHDIPNNVLVIRKYASPNFGTYEWKSYSTSGEPHKVIALKQGGYAAAARNSFAIIKDDLTCCTYSIGSKMASWRAPIAAPDDASHFISRWKQGDAGTTTTAVDFLELAETPDGNYVCAVFLYHQWADSGAEQMRWGLAISDLAQGGKMTLHDLNLTAATSKDNLIEIAKQIEIACLDNSHLVIGHRNAVSETNARQGNELVVINFKNILAGSPLTAEVWYGKLHSGLGYDAGVSGLFVDSDGTLYYTMTDDYQGGCNKIIIGKAKWDGSKLSVIKSVERNAAIGFGASVGFLNPDLTANISSDYFIIAGRSQSDLSKYAGFPCFSKVRKSDLFAGDMQAIPYTSGQGTSDTHYAPAILDVAPLDANKLAVLMRNTYDNKGPFSLLTVELK